MKRPRPQQRHRQQQRDDVPYGLQDFRNDIRELLCDGDAKNGAVDSGGSGGSGTLVVSFSRSALGQTGDGHFSPLAAYHEGTDQVLILDVARFKYQPYWCSVESLYGAMIPHDPTTQQSRGWYKLYPPPPPPNGNGNGNNDNNYQSHSALSSSNSSISTGTEQRKPARFVPLYNEQNDENHPCPLHSVKINYCQALRPPRRQRQRQRQLEPQPQPHLR